MTTGGGTLRRIDDGDLETVRRWRNHPKVRAASFTTHEIGAAEHARWWRAVRDDPDREVLLYEHGGEGAGVVAFTGLTGGDAGATWGFYLDVDGLERSGRLLEAWFGIERAAVGHAFGPLGLRTLRGEVLAGNDAVRRLHRRFGFTEVGSYLRDVDGVPREVVVVRLDREEAP
ncbi:UDP-4-amino-4,6-dideoxy-N-acetyl-beta-L-altrosamine N-acetyltransferase [Streptosporangium becharense]|uniref:UDP-4-amino-4, 6-dideoxy-N-acetyl-beta-L-altrosamine N-acetyltransferase n=1 Tax=Streptosporangium becharense TaxID=1816182 RepID=A0A7W9MGL5_9ACTN|nr:GNAT family N-acetyltransferase [Streptosporangium becharense]MBB2909535.1 UDP-4-amino-4,6-dideoxy-N-acetyl-beta-L-altrosamine N-acetyltransferase [Streptosporangium becharense]MBB5819508.1 UDP-4-amino-4,6-dideoxy-N-acetyl-beta-L-altrosamine N-acetyltransferase [Streptosporangium becharense]